MTVCQNRFVGLFCVLLLVLSGTSIGDGYEGGSGTADDPRVSCVLVKASLSLIQGPPKEVRGAMEVDCTISHLPNGWTWNIDLELTDPLLTRWTCGVHPQITPTFKRTFDIIRPHDSGPWIFEFEATVKDASGNIKHLLGMGQFFNSF